MARTKVWRWADEGGEPNEPNEPEQNDWRWDEDNAPEARYTKRPTFADSALSAWGDTVSFQLGDEIQAGLAGVGGMFQGKDFGETYKQSLDDARAWQELSQIYEPGANALGMAAGFLTGGFPVGVGANLVSRGLLRGLGGLGAAQKSTLGQRALATGASGALGGAVSGVGGTKDGQSWQENAMWGAGAGAALGPAMYYGGAKVKNFIADKFDKSFGARGGSEGKAADIFDEIRALNGQGHGDLEGRIDDMVPRFGPKGELLSGQPHAWVGDAMVNRDGDNYGFGLLKAASGKEGPALVSAKARAKTRNMAIGDETGDMIWDKTPDVGKRKTFYEIMRDVGDEDEALSAVYDRLHGVKLPVTGEMAAIIQRPKVLGGPMSRVARSMLDDLPGSPEMEIGPNQMLELAKNPRFWQKTLTETRKEMELAYTRGDVEVSRIKDGYNYLRSVMGKTIGPDWTKTQEAWATNKLREEAAKFAHKAVMETDGVKVAENLSKIDKWEEAIDAGRKLKPLSASATPDERAAHDYTLRAAARARAERQAAKQGAVARLEEGIKKQQTRSGVRNVLRNLGDNPLHQEVIMRMLGARRVTTGPNKGQWDQRYNISDLLDRLDDKYKMFDNIETSGIVKGPKTAEIIGGGAAIDSMTDAVDVTKDIASGNILGAIFKSLDKNKAEKFARQSAEVHNEIVRLISMPVEQAQKELGKYGGASGWLRSRSALERARILAERRANQPALNAKLMQEALGASGLYGGVGGADLGTFFGEILSPPDRY
jgi:hypothetical protein